MAGDALIRPTAEPSRRDWIAVMSAMLGYAVFQYQGALGFAAAAEDEHAGFPEAEYRKRRALAEAEIRLKEGQAGQALEILGKALDRDANDLRLNERYHQLLFAMQARERCLRHLAHYLPLAARQNPAQAAAAMLNARQLQGDYLPEDALVCEKVAEALLARGAANGVGGFLAQQRVVAADFIRMGQVPVHLVGGDVMEAKSRLAYLVQTIPIGTCRLKQHIGADDIGLDEVGGACDRAINVTLGGQVHHGIRLMGSKHPIQFDAAADVDLLERVTIAARDLSQGFQVACIGQLVEVDN